MPQILDSSYNSAERVGKDGKVALLALPHTERSVTAYHVTSCIGTGTQRTTVRASMLGSNLESTEVLMSHASIQKSHNFITV